MVSQNCILIETSPGEIRAALVEAGQITELFIERASALSRLGEIDLVRVSSVRRDFGGVFVEAEWGAGFLKLPGGADYPDEGELVTAELIKDASGGKEPAFRLGWELKSENLVLSQGNGEVSVSRKMKPESRRKQLRGLFDGKVASGNALTVRTSAGAVDDSDLVAELTTLSTGAERLSGDQSDQRKPAVLMSAPSLRARLARSFPTLEIVNFDSQNPGDDYGLEDAFEDAATHIVEKNRGFRLTFDYTEALAVIDVDSAGTLNSDAKTLNLSAADEIARLIRLRRDSGLILIDFLRMTDKAGRAAVAERLAGHFQDDAGEMQVHGWTRSGLLEMTRQRIGPSIPEILCGRMRPAVLSAETLGLSALRRVLRETRGTARPKVTCSPEVTRYLEMDGAAYKTGCEQKIGGPIDIIADPTYPRHKVELS